MRTIYIIMGVSGVGKTTIGKLLAQQLEIPFYDADDFHPKANRDKMASGTPLEDSDRWPWLDMLASQIKEWSHTGAVLACSALKESYREILTVHQDVIFIHLHATFDVISKRIQERTNHYFKPELLQSQFDVLETPKDAIAISVLDKPEIIVQNIVSVIQKKAAIGLIGLGVMGTSLARNFAKNGMSIALYNRHVAGKEENVAKNCIAQYPELAQASGFDDLQAFVASLSLPRKVFLMVNAGPAVDAVIAAIRPFLSPGDILMDGGNSHYNDTQRRFDELKELQIHFLGVGVSGGEKGALEGPSIMPGGSKEAYSFVGPSLEKIAAKDINRNPCCTRVGDGGSGHFVKMIHNGIEYAEMQLIAEVYDVLKTNVSLDNEGIASIFKEWNDSDLESYLLEISGNILTHKEDGQYLIDLILDKAKQKGTGGWSTTAALEIGASLDTISQAVMARIVSGYKKERVEASTRFTLSRKANTTLSLATVREAYKTARIINHCIGIEALRKASQEYNWALNLSEITRIWTNGCIIRSAFMEQLEPLLSQSETSLFLTEAIQEQLQEGLDALIEFTSFAAQGHTALPVFSAALQYILSYMRGDSSASMIQAQRDYFGAHTYERKDKPGSFHTNWEI